MPAGLGLAERRMDLAEVAARRGQAAALDAALRTHLGVGLPAPGRTSTHGDVAALWIAPETALVMAPPAGLAGLRAAIAPALGAVVDQGSGFAVLRLDGPRAAATLARGCRIDLDPRAFAAGRVARTIVAQIPAIVRCVVPGTAFDLIVPATLARSFVAFLQHAAASA